MIRVLLVDDSPTSRKLLRHILVADHDVEVVAEAQNGAEAVQKTKSLHPNVVLMDIHMPVLDGLEATREIMCDAPTPIVLVSASTRVHEVETAMQSLDAGALTLLLKPTAPDAPDFERLSHSLVETVKAMSDVKVIRRLRHLQTPRVTSPEQPPQRTREAATTSKLPIAICAIATSTGGPPALHRILSELPKEFPAPIVIVQHIAAGFASGLVNWLNSAISLPVKLATHGEALEAGTVYFAPENQHLGVTPNGKVELSDAAPISGFRPSATHLFRSVGQSYRSRALAIILTGMGRDGVDGLHTVHKQGGSIIAQDESTSVVFGMPGTTIAEIPSAEVVPLEAIASKILARCRISGSAGFNFQ
jgi:two-component system chemotaxis response regulator CheB